MAADIDTTGRDGEGIEATEEAVEIVAENPQPGRKRGRRSKDAGSDQPPSDTSQAKETAGGARRATTKKAATTKAARRKAESAAAEFATLMVEIVNMAATTALGPEAAMNDFERGLIEPGLSNILARTSDEAMQRFLSFSDLLMVGMGSAMWFMRIRQQGAAPVRDDIEVEAGPVEAAPTPSWWQSAEDNWDVAIKAGGEV